MAGLERLARRSGTLVAPPPFGGSDGKFARSGMGRSVFMTWEASRAIVLRPVAMPFDLAQCRDRDPGLDLSTCVEPAAHSFLPLHSSGRRSPPKPRVNLPRPWRENS